MYAKIKPSIRQYPLIPCKGHELGYFVKNRTTGGDLEQEFGFAPYKVVSIDLSNPEASEWFKQKIIIENTINFGFKGWMADFGKFLLVQPYFSTPNFR